ncbi:hypothetical protein IWW38_004733 [Coemansia aciculifera]|uniref:Uncharacterized protein n=1 Tax=Coemansia aciculifera TaxID=417176 RepID=A0ACC1LXJ1_9FUNG|nr:hypothetical protein IWW38_004733 [Coemansia aciculifera]
MLTDRQREAWAKHFDAEGIKYLFFSAKESNEQLEAEREHEEAERLARDMRMHTMNEDEVAEMQRVDAKEAQDEEERIAAAAGTTEADDFEARVQAVDLDDAALRTRVLTPAELVWVLMRECPQLADEHSHNRLVIGLVGYPNVGKSSTINALVGAKKVNVGAMPGKTKHFQTIHLTSDVVLCDCPGLVFPTFATTQADMVCNGVLPIDQLREFTGPSALVAARIPKVVLEAIYGIEIRTRPIDEGGSGLPTAEELLCAYAAARGLFKGGEGNPDEARAARVILKDYVNGKLLYCQPPPTWQASDDELFNAEHYDLATLAKSTRNIVADGDDFAVRHAASDRLNVRRAIAGAGSSRIAALDSRFFAAANATGAALLAAQRNAKGYDVRQGAGYAQTSAPTAAPRVNDRGEPIAPADAAKAARPPKSTDKHHKKKKPGKQRSGQGIFDDF